MTASSYRSPTRSFVLQPEHASSLLEYLWPGEFAPDEHKRLLRCLYLTSNGSELVLEKFIEIYRRADPSFGDCDTESRIRSAWSRLAGFTCEHAIQAELKAICAPQVPWSLMHSLFDDLSSALFDDLSCDA